MMERWRPETNFGELVRGYIAAASEAGIISQALFEAALDLVVTQVSGTGGDVAIQQFYTITLRVVTPFEPSSQYSLTN